MNCYIFGMKMTNIENLDYFARRVRESKTTGAILVSTKLLDEYRSETGDYTSSVRVAKSNLINQLQAAKKI